MKTLAVMMAALLAGGCASVQSPAGWRPQNDAVTTMHYDCASPRPTAWLPK